MFVAVVLTKLTLDHYIVPNNIGFRDGDKQLPRDNGRFSNMPKLSVSLLIDIPDLYV